MCIHQIGSGFELDIVEECRHQFLDFHAIACTNTVQFVNIRCCENICVPFLEELIIKSGTSHNPLACEFCGPLMDKYFDIIKNIFRQKLKRPYLLYRSIRSISRLDRTSLLYKCFRYVGNHKHKFSVDVLPKDVRNLLHIYLI